MQQINKNNLGSSIRLKYWRCHDELHSRAIQSLLYEPRNNIIITSNKAS